VERSREELLPNVPKVLLTPARRMTAVAQMTAASMEKNAMSVYFTGDLVGTFRGFSKLDGVAVTINWRLSFLSSV